MTNLRISDMAEQSKPCEKALQYGIKSLGDAELLAVILRSGTKDANVIRLAEEILSFHPVHKGLTGLNYLTYEDFTGIHGVGKVKAVQLLAVAELSRRIARERTKPYVTMDTPLTIADYFREEVRYLQKERVYALLFTTGNGFIRDVLISEGTMTKSLTAPPEVFREAIRFGASYVVLLHNHPSGCVDPSRSDISLTKRFLKAGELIGVPLLDHIIIGGSEYLSFRERGLL